MTSRACCWCTQTMKMVVVGDVGVGKTSLIVRLTSGIFQDGYNPTIFDIYRTTVMYKGAPKNLEIVDTPGYDGYARLRPLSYPNTDVFLICMSVIRHEDSYLRCWNGWYPEIKHHCPNAVFILVGTKCDLRDKSPSPSHDITLVPFDEMKDFARRMGAYSYIECSGLTGKYVTEVFKIAISAAIPSSYKSKSKKERVFMKSLRAKLQINISDAYNFGQRPAKLGMIAKIHNHLSEPRWGHAMVYLPPKLYVFCGAHDTSTEVVLEATTKIFSIEEEFSHTRVPHTEGFEKRTFPTAAVIRISTQVNYTNKVSYRALIFGGKSDVYRADVHIFDPERQYISQFETTGKAPSPRFAMTSVAYKNNLYVMGGYDKDGSICDDLFMLNTEKKEWQKINIHGTPPPARMYHSTVCLDNMMVVYGGKGEKNAILDDMYLINLDTGISERCMSDKSPGPRQNHASLALNRDEMVLIGGVTKVGAPSNDVFIFSLSSKQWTKVNITGEFPKREMHTAVFTGTDIWVYGGKGKDGQPLLLTKLTANFFTQRFYEVLPRHLTLYMLSFLNPMELTRFGQACMTTHEVAEENALWIQQCKLKDPSYKYMPAPNHNKTRDKSITPKQHLASLTTIWINPCNVPADPMPEYSVIPINIFVVIYVLVVVLQGISVAHLVHIPFAHLVPISFVYTALLSL